MAEMENKKNVIDADEAATTENKKPGTDKGEPEQKQTKQTSRGKKSQKKATENLEIEKPDKKTEKKIGFSVRVDVANAATWRAFTHATDKSLEELLTAAVSEYLKKHPLSGDEKIIFDLKKKKYENEQKK